MSTDPNWLPSTLAQSTAALVAITGGLLVSRLVGLSAERGGLIHRRDDLVARRALIEAELKRADGERLDRCLEWLSEHHLSDFIEARGVVDVEDALEEFTPRGSDAEEMRPHLEALALSVRTAFTELETAYPVESAPPPEDFKSLRERLPAADATHRDVYEGVAAQIGHDRYRPKNSFDALVRRPMVRGIIPDIVFERHDRAIERTNVLRAQVAAFDAEIGLIDEQSDRFSKPDGVYSGIAVLTFFAAVGIALPMVLMAMRPVPSSMTARGALVGAFVVGFAVFVLYLIALVRRLPLGSSESQP